MMYNLNKNRRNAIAAAMTLATLVTIIVLASNMATTPVAAVLASTREAGFKILNPGAPAVVSGDNIYIAWWTNNTENGNEEVMFRASNDAGATFSDKINLSNTTDADSWRVEIAAEGENVAVTWWETNQTSDIPVARISTDAGETFGPVLTLAANGTIASTEEEGEEGEA
jgi:hypothetical protein